MRLGVIADVHGNLPALEAVLARLSGLSVDRIVNLGDCASGPLWPAETVRLLRATPMSHVRGNHDRALGAALPDGLGASDSFAWRNLDADARNWLAGLPFELEVGGARCVHASPKDDDTYLLDAIEGGRLVAARPEAVEALLGPGGPAVVLCGHSHQPRLLQLDDGRVVVNPGSVGNPAYNAGEPRIHVSESGAPHARFAVVTMTETIAIEHHATAYDWRHAARRAEANGRADWAHALQTGRVPPAR
ncbi:metallophosphoesterase family protein [Bosea sp. (in: a-proteobacteria)]|jgi:putative phosphoesterase|uniref:metallophosphoesterase family protein n=1 Tax=Bosea sp. (in: a-proteobacteria) TaxID=1871050 RepID=UPI002DDD1C2F|nr:metallophosphoesterase family protein [Bosea sp. (in: a-proteobacteria)]HEV2512573.1 metallophosphoesterase family protein [Bosea sp. (in: a-proteobacteria)]